MYVYIVYIHIVVTTTTSIMDSLECPEYRVVRYCARIAQVSSKKRNIGIFV